MARFAVRLTGGDLPTIYPQGQTSIDLYVYRDGALCDLTDARFTLVMGGLTTSSEDYPSAFSAGPPLATGLLRLSLGGFNWSPGRYGARLAMFTAEFPDGVILAEALFFQVAASIAAATAFTTGGVVFVDGVGSKWLFYVDADGNPTTATYAGDLVGVTELEFTDPSGDRYTLAVDVDGNPILTPT